MQSLEYSFVHSCGETNYILLNLHSYCKFLTSAEHEKKEENSGWIKRNSKNMKSALMLKEDSWFKITQVTLAAYIWHLESSRACTYICMRAMCCWHINKVPLHFHRGKIYNMQLHHIASSTNNLHIFNWLDHLSVWWSSACNLIHIFPSFLFFFKGMRKVLFIYNPLLFFFSFARGFSLLCNVCSTF